MYITSNSYCKKSCYFVVFCYVLTGFIISETLGECDNWWLEDQYGDIVSTINNRPNFPAALTEAFQVCERHIPKDVLTVPC